MGRHKGLVAVALAAVSIAGCQGEESERAVAAVHGLLGAFERADGVAACDHLAEAGVSELLLAGVRARVDPAGLDAPGARPCAIVARRLARDARAHLTRLRRAPVTGVVLEGDRAAVRTSAGAYEAREVEGRWRVARLEPVVAALTGEPPPAPPVHVTVVRPRLEEPALGPSLAGRTDDATVAISGSLEPDDATLRVVRSSGARVERTEVRDGRFRIRVALRPGANRLLLEADAPGREATELSIELTRGTP